MSRRRLVSFVLAAVLAAGTTFACGGAPPAAREADQLLSAGDVAGAGRLIDDGLSKDPRSPYFWRLKIRLDMALGDNAAAVADYKQWRELHGGSDDPAALRQMSRLTLWQGLRSPSPEVRIAATLVIERANLDAFAEDVSRLLGDDHDLVRATAAAAILRGHPDAPALVEESLHSPDPEVRLVGVAVLQRKVGEYARDDLRSLLRDPDPRVRAAVLTALAGLHVAADRDAFRDHARRDPAGPARAAALRALVGDASAPTLELARKALGDAYLGARLAALEVIAKAEGERAQPELVRLAGGTDLYLAVRAGVLLAGQDRPGPGTEAVRRALETQEPKEWPLRAAALNALAEVVAVDRAVPLATAASHEAEPQVRFAAARALARLGRKQDAIAITAELVASTDELVRLAAALDLARFQDARGRAALLHLTREGTPSTRKAALMALPSPTAESNVPEAAVTDAILAALADPTGELRIAAAEQLL